MAERTAGTRPVLTSSHVTSCTVVSRYYAPHFAHYIQPKVGRGRIFRILVSTIRPLKKFCYVYDTAMVHVYSYKSTNDRQYCSWPPCVVSLHLREELPLQREGHNIHNDFAVAILQYCLSCTTGHFLVFLQKSGSEMTCVVNVNGDYSI